MDFSAALKDGEEGLPEVSTGWLVPVDIALVKPNFAQYAAEIQVWEEEIAALEVKDEFSRVRATELGGSAHGLLKDLEDKKLETTKPYREFTSKVNGFVAQFTDRLKSVKERAEIKLSNYRHWLDIEGQKQKAAAEKAAKEFQAKLDAEAEEATRKLREDAKRKAEAEAKELGVDPSKVIIPETPKIAAPQVPMPVFGETKNTVRTESGSSYSNEPWVCEVIDEKLVPVEYKIVKQRLLDDAVKEGKREIPGTKIYQRFKTKFRR